MPENTPRPVAVITGSARGIGLACCRVFRAAGWHVVGLDRDPTPGDAVDRAELVDLALPEEISSFFRGVAAKEGRCSALVNNAALQVCGPPDALDLADWDRVMNVNVRAAFWCIHEALPLLRQRPKEGSVVNVASVHAIATSRQIVAYAASKGALWAMTRALALDLAADGIRVNAVLPGAVDTPMLRDGLSRGHVAPGQDPFASFERRHVLGRVARPEEIAEAILFLASPARAGYITGTSLVVDGGVTIALSTEVNL